jgi:hypothetical protein
MKQLQSRMLLFIMIAVGCGWLGKLVDMILIDQPEGQSSFLRPAVLWLVRL